MVATASFLRLATRQLQTDSQNCDAPGIPTPAGTVGGICCGPHSLTGRASRRDVPRGEHMQKALMEMNLQLHHFVSDITGVTTAPSHTCFACVVSTGPSFVCKRSEGRKYKVPTDSNQTFHIASNLMDCDFAENDLNQKWAGYITARHCPRTNGGQRLAWTREGWLYLAVIRQPAGFCVANAERAPHRSSFSWFAGEPLTGCRTVNIAHTTIRKSCANTTFKSP